MCVCVFKSVCVCLCLRQWPSEGLMGPWCVRKRSIFQGWVQVRHTRCEKERKSAYSLQSLCILGPVITSESFVFIFKKPPLLPCQPILTTFKIHRQIIKLSKKQTFCLSHLQMPTRNTVSLYCVYCEAVKDCCAL